MITNEKWRSLQRECHFCIGHAEGVAVGMVSEAERGVKTQGWRIVWIDEQCGDGETERGSMLDLVLHEASGNALATIFGQDGKRVDVILSLAGLVLSIREIHVIDFLVVRLAAIVEEAESVEASLMIALAIVAETEADGTVSVASQEGVAIGIEDLWPTATDVAGNEVEFLGRGMRMQGAADTPRHERCIGQRGPTVGDHNIKGRIDRIMQSETISSVHHSLAEERRLA